ncbi:LysR family transcriptional regulator [Pelagibius sp. Alg239-R121]|uniref:LysR family transcriptional regulator n=1 Tax=Pelagibius sp. Alg239-R121 TaxID=2993448 RepID=UPI0024A7647C|nr:LysR family transcriptional regulator [Pelagibius sp. Alg239-R121]
MDYLSAMRVFLTVVDTQGFTAASKALSMPLPTVCRKIANLEQHLGAQLLVRTTRSLKVTENGQRYYDDVRRILDEIDDAERQVAGEYRRPKGRLSISAPTLFGRLHVLPIATEFITAHEDIDLNFNLTNDVVDLIESHTDLAIRIGPLSDSSMIALKVGSVRQILCASQDYFADHGIPASPADLARLDCISYGGSANWSFKTGDGKVRQYPVRTRFRVNSVEGIVSAARQGSGLAQLYSYQAARHIADGSLAVALPEHEIDPVPVSIVYPQGRHIPQKLRVFIDFAIPRLRESLDLVGQQCSVGIVASMPSATH